MKKFTFFKHFKNKLEITPLGFSFPITLQDDASLWALCAWLNQITEEEFALKDDKAWFLSWDNFYRLQNNPNHVESLSLAGFPAIKKVTVCLKSRHALRDADFSIYIDQIVTNDNTPITHFTGASFQYDKTTYIMDLASWVLINAVALFKKQQEINPGEETNQSGWADIRMLAKQAGARLDKFLERTLVIKPHHLKLKLKRGTFLGTDILQIEPCFKEEPPEWLDRFDRNPDVKDAYRIMHKNGVTHVILTPAVQDILKVIKKFPERSVVGDDSIRFIRNPYAFIGDKAVEVLPIEEYEESLKEGHIHFYHFRIDPVIENEKIHALTLVLLPATEDVHEEITDTFHEPKEFKKFLNLLERALRKHNPFSSWKKHLLELSQFTDQQFNALKTLYEAWQNESAGIDLANILDLNNYGSRVIGFGEQPTLKSPWLLPKKGEDWFGPDSQGPLVEELLANWERDNPQQLEELKARINQAIEENKPFVVLPWSGIDISVTDAKVFATEWEKLFTTPPDPGEPKENTPRISLLIKENINRLLYEIARKNELSNNVAPVEIPSLFKPTLSFKQHQLEGLAWLQHRFLKSPSVCNGCLLADDMGVGKTLQILALSTWLLEKDPDTDPILIVAPVSLLDNWMNELDKFFDAKHIPLLKLYGDDLQHVKCDIADIPQELQEKGIKRLLIPNWIGNNKIVLTTYETLRNYEFSLATQKWSLMVCDEAQKIKNPQSLISRVCKAINVRFKIACTGTPVENTLIDLWNLFDFIQPGFLGTLNEFGRTYVDPIERQVDPDKDVLTKLYDLIKPQTLRRTKKDVANDLPHKTEDEACKTIPMVPNQRKLYRSTIELWRNNGISRAIKASGKGGILSVLHSLRMICALPTYKADATTQLLLKESPKLAWLMNTLTHIKNSSDDKVIIFTEFREIQRVIQKEIKNTLHITASIINGSTNANSSHDVNRQGLINNFQSKKGFNVIILSTTAVGFGVNIQEANHVIHFTRSWNPAKEDQATDRAYRIGQTKDVYVYCPTVVDPEFETFEVKLDHLLTQKRVLAENMLTPRSEIGAGEFGDIL